MKDPVVLCSNYYGENNKMAVNKKKRKKERKKKQSHIRIARSALLQKRDTDGNDTFQCDVSWLPDQETRLRL